MRIARDLHDALGHHLTALSLQLDVASRLTSGRAADHLQEAHAIAKLLLSDVRDVVSQMRESSHLNLADAVSALTRAAGTLQIHLDMPESVEVDAAAQAHAVTAALTAFQVNARAAQDPSKPQPQQPQQQPQQQAPGQVDLDELELEDKPGELSGKDRHRRRGSRPGAGAAPLHD